MNTGDKKRPFVTEVRIQLTEKPPILAFASVTLWGAIVVHDLRLLVRHDGTRVVLMPRLKGPDGSWSPVAHPIREEARKRIEECVIHAFEDLAARNRAAFSQSDPITSGSDCSSMRAATQP